MLWPRYLTQTHEIFKQKIGAYVLFKTFFQNYFCILRNRMASLSHIYFGMKHHVQQEMVQAHDTTHLSRRKDIEALIDAPELETLTGRIVAHP